MDTVQFLRKILPTSGIYCAARLVKDKFRNQPCDSIEELAAWVQHYDSQAVAAYHACAVYRERTTEETKDGKTTNYFRRKQANVQALKAFWMDLDVQAGNPQKFETQDAAIDGLVNFCEASGLPVPLVVSSGGGIHIYWTLTEAVGVDSWRLTAEGLKALAGRLAFHSDPACTADSARVLRPCGTWNRKTDPARAVELVADALPIAFGEFSAHVNAALARHGVKRPETIKLREGPTERINAQFAVQQNWPPTEIRRVADRCAQLGKMRDTKGCITEPHWYAGIQLMTHGVEGDELIHEWSNGYAGYTQEETNRKIAQIRIQSLGPTLCTTFNERNTGGCDGCAFKGKISSPAQLGSTPKNDPPPPVILPAEGNIVAQEVELPPVPSPFARSSEGVFMTEEGVQHRIYGYDIYPTGLLYDEHVGYEVLRLRHWLPQEGWQDCSVRSSLLAKPTDFECALRDNSIQPDSNKRMVMYVNTYVARLRQSTAMRRLFKSMGWKTEGTEFVLGDRMYRANGEIIQAGHSQHAGGYLSDFKVKGDLAEWRKLTTMFQRKGFEPHAFMLLMAFAAPLLELGGRDGFTVAALGETGVGKSTMGKFLASVYGHPEETWIGKLATAHARVERLGAYSAIPAYMDEITTIEPKELRELVYMMPTGKGRDSLTRTRELRDAARWKTILVVSTNDSLQTKLQAVKQNAEAEGMRLFEFRFPKDDLFPKIAKEFIHPVLAEHYGVAGGHYIKQLVEHRNRIKVEIGPAILAIEREFEMLDKERFWSQAAALALYGGRLAREWGIIDFDPACIKAWLCEETKHMRGELQGAMVSPTAIFAQFLDEHVGERVIVNGVNSGLTSVQALPNRGVLSQRMELDTKLLYVAKDKINHWCQERNHNYALIRDSLFRDGILLSYQGNCTLGKGTNIKGGSVPCWRIKSDHPALTAETKEGIANA